VKIFDDQFAQARRDPILLRQYFWRAATICRRKGLRHSALTIANNMQEMADALARRAGGQSKITTARRDLVVEDEE
jgi:hypothetical protein